MGNFESPDMEVVLSTDPKTSTSTDPTYIVLVTSANLPDTDGAKITFSRSGTAAIAKYQ